MINKINIKCERQKIFIYIILSLVTLAVFWQVNHYDFIDFDDHIYVKENTQVTSGITLDGLRWAFSPDSAKQTGLWHPLTWLSLMLDYHLFGLNAGLFHMTNLLLHIMSTLLLFWLFNRMNGSVHQSAFIASFFAIHPLHVESVVWIAERKDVLSAFFWILTLCMYVYYTEKPILKRYLFVLFSFILALMSKPMVVTLPVIMILLDYWPLKRFELKKGHMILWQAQEKIPLLLLSLGFSMVTLCAQFRPDERNLNFSLIDQFVNVPVALLTYLEKILFPHNLAVFYPFSTQISSGQAMGASLFILIISLTIIVMVKRMPFFFTGWLWYIITILPVIGIIQIGEHAMADRYTYLPSIGISVMLAWGVPFFLRSGDTQKTILFSSSIAFLVVLAFLSWMQCHYWKNAKEIWNHALQVTKHNYIAHQSVASALFAEGKYEEALFHSNEAIRLYPVFSKGYNTRGLVYFKLGQYQQAIKDYNEVIRLEPNYADAFNNRGVAHLHLGQYQQAIKDYNTAIKIEPHYADAYNNRGLAHFLQAENDLGCRDVLMGCALGHCSILKTAKSKGLCHASKKSNKSFK